MNIYLHWNTLLYTLNTYLCILRIYNMYIKKNTQNRVQKEYIAAFIISIEWIGHD